MHEISATYFMAYSNMHCMVCILYLYISMHCICLRRVCVTLLCMHIQRSVPHLEQSLQMYVQAYAKLSATVNIAFDGSSVVTGQ